MLRELNIILDNLNTLMVDVSSKAEDHPDAKEEFDDILNSIVDAIDSVSIRYEKEAEEIDANKDVEHSDCMRDMRLGN